MRTHCHLQKSAVSVLEATLALCLSSRRGVHHSAWREQRGGARSVSKPASRNNLKIVKIIGGPVKLSAGFAQNVTVNKIISPSTSGAPLGDGADNAWHAVSARVRMRTARRGSTCRARAEVQQAVHRERLHRRRRCTRRRRHSARHRAVCAKMLGGANQIVSSITTCNGK